MERQAILSVLVSLAEDIPSFIGVIVMIFLLLLPLQGKWNEVFQDKFQMFLVFFSVTTYDF